MSNYAIIRVKKLKTLASVALSARHCFREHETPNADPGRTPQNVQNGPETSEGVTQGVRGLLPEKHRKDAVRCLEYLVTASPEAFKSGGGLFWTGSAQAYFDDSLKWLKDRHGAENVVASVVHNDETTPHMTVYVVPKVDGKLSAKHFCGGRQKLAQLQTDFAEQVGKNYGVNRGKARKVGDERVQHVTIKEFYEDLGQRAAAERQELAAGQEALRRSRADLVALEAKIDTKKAKLEEFNKAVAENARRLVTDRDAYVREFLDQLKQAKTPEERKLVMQTPLPVKKGRGR